MRTIGRVFSRYGIINRWSAEVIPRVSICAALTIAPLIACDLVAGDEPTELPGDTAIHVPTPPDVVAKMLELARVHRGDVLYDLGCGDGRILVAAAAKHGCRAVGYDIDERKVEQSRQNAAQNGVQQLVRVEKRDIFTLDLQAATVVTLFLLPEMNERLIPQLERMKKGSRIVCHEFPLEGIAHESMETVKSKVDGVPRDVYLYRVPLNRDSKAARE